MLLPVALIAASLLVGQADSATKAEVTKSVEAVKNAFEAGDVDAIRRYTTADHVAISGDFQYFTRDAQLKALDQLKFKSYKIRELRIMPLTVDVALVTYEADVEGTFAGEPLPTKMRVLSTYVRRDGTWAEASYQETPLSD